MSSTEVIFGAKGQGQKVNNIDDTCKCATNKMYVSSEKRL